MKTKTVLVIIGLCLTAVLFQLASQNNINHSLAAPNLTPTVANYLPIIHKAITPTPTATAVATATATPTPSVTPTNTPPAPPSGDNVVCQAFDNVQLCSWVSNGNPPRFSSVTVYGRLYIDGVPVMDLNMDTTWHYLTTTPTCSGVTNSQGIASCSRSIGGATSGYQVNVDVMIAGRMVTTWFIPQ